MSAPLSGKVALVSGASRGIGAAIARTLARDGAKLVLIARSEADMRNVAADCGADCVVVPGDLREDAAAQAAVAAGARVKRALEILGSDIPDHLRYAGELRLKFKDASLDELGHHANPPMTKDAVAGRIRRLLAMADKKAEELGIPATDADLPEDLED